MKRKVEEELIILNVLDRELAVVILFLAAYKQKKEGVKEPIVIELNDGSKAIYLPEMEIP